MIDVSTGNICPFCGMVLSAPQAISRPAYGAAVTGLVFGILTMLLLLYSTVKGMPHVGTLTELIVRMSGSDLPLAAILSIPGVICSCVAVGRKMPAPSPR